MAGPFVLPRRVVHSYAIPGTAQTGVLIEQSLWEFTFCNYFGWQNLRWLQTQSGPRLEKKRFCLRNRGINCNDKTGHCNHADGMSTRNYFQMDDLDVEQVSIQEPACLQDARVHEEEEASIKNYFQLDKVDNDDAETTADASECSDEDAMNMAPPQSEIEVTRKVRFTMPEEELAEFAPLTTKGLCDETQWVSVSEEAGRIEVLPVDPSVVRKHIATGQSDLEESKVQGGMKAMTVHGRVNLHNVTTRKRQIQQGHLPPPPGLGLEDRVPMDTVATSRCDDVSCHETSWVAVATAEAVQDAQEEKCPLEVARFLFRRTAKTSKWVWISVTKSAGESDEKSVSSEADPSEVSTDSEVEPDENGNDVQDGLWLEYESSDWQHPLKLQAAFLGVADNVSADAFLGVTDKVSASTAPVNKSNSENNSAPKDSTHLTIRKFGKMLTEGYEDFYQQPRAVTLSITRPLSIQNNFQKFLKEQHEASTVLHNCAAWYEKFGCRGVPGRRCNRQYLVLWWLNFCRTRFLADMNYFFEKSQKDCSLDKFIDTKFDKENEEYNTAWNEIMKEDDDELPWFQRPNPVALRLHQHPRSYVPMPFRVQDIDGQCPDRSNKQVKVTNIPAHFQSAQLKGLFGECCHGRFEKVYVPSECGPCCTRVRCSGRWIDCEDPVSRGFAYITFMEHKHAQSAINMNGQKVDSLIIGVTWAKNINTLESAVEKSQKWTQACMDKDAEFAHRKATASQSQMIVSQRPVCIECPLDFQFEGKIKGRSDGHRGNKLTRGFIEVNPKQLSVLRSHPLWQDGFKTDVFWHRNDCNNRETRFPGDVVTFTVTVGSTREGMQAQHIQLK